MAEAVFTHACGHKGRVSGRNRSEADSRARKAALEICSDCKHIAAYNAAMEEAAALGLPPIAGVSKEQTELATVRRHERWPTVGPLTEQIAAAREAFLTTTTHCETLIAANAANDRRLSDLVVGWSQRKKGERIPYEALPAEARESVRTHVSLALDEALKAVGTAHSTTAPQFWINHDQGPREAASGAFRKSAADLVAVLRTSLGLPEFDLHICSAKITAPDQFDHILSDLVRLGKVMAEAAQP